MKEGRFFTVFLPWPPSQNESLVPGRGTRRLVKTKKSRNWFASATKLCAEACGVGYVFPVEPVAVHIELYFEGRRESDIDNGVKKVLDAMTDAQVWQDDKQVNHLSVGTYRSPVKGEGYIVVYAWEYMGSYGGPIYNLLEALHSQTFVMREIHPGGDAGSRVTTDESRAP